MLHDLLKFIYMYVIHDTTGGVLSMTDKLGVYYTPQDLLTKESLFQALGVRNVCQNFKISCVNHSSGPAILIGQDKMQDLFLR